MTTFRAHFDGRVLVPDEPVNLPTDRPLELQAREVPKAPTASTTEAFPTFPVKPGARTIRTDDVRRAEDED